MICYTDSNALVFGVLTPKKSSKTFAKMVDISGEGNEFYSLLNVTTYDELKDNMDSALLHEKLNDCLGRGDCYTYKKSKIDFKKRLAYVDSYDKKTNDGEVREYHLENPEVAEICMKGSYNSFIYGRKVTINDKCNLYRMLVNDKKALQEIRDIIKNEDKEQAQAIIALKYPEFALFYKIMSEVKFEESCIFSVRALNQARHVDLVAASMLDMLPLAEENARILRLLPKKD